VSFRYNFDRMRRVVRLYTGGKTFREIGLELGCSKQNAGQIYYRALKLWKDRHLEADPLPEPTCPVCERAWPEANHRPEAEKVVASDPPTS
jgi:hypothetical protein